MLIRDPPVGALPRLNLLHCPTTLNRSTAAVCGETGFIMRDMVIRVELEGLPNPTTRILLLGARLRGRAVTQILVGCQFVSSFFPLLRLA